FNWVFAEKLREGNEKSAADIKRHELPLSAYRLLQGYDLELELRVFSAEMLQGRYFRPIDVSLFDFDDEALVILCCYYIGTIAVYEVRRIEPAFQARLDLISLTE